ncbi:tyrosine-type recombinase/integrase [Priestia megaterium]|uniref:tyrosine-type recombinase/integrase n=2 Tax=Priestia megaterium TaxID=1404 RepID=UPI0015970276|nr:site-specific integrase [Priestia megaterium]
MDNKMTLNQFLPKWLDMAAKRRVRETTFDNYQRAVNVRILPILGHVRLTELNGAVCQKFFNHLVDEGLSERYIEYIYTVFNGALEKAIDWDLLLKNPLRKVDIPRDRRRKYVVWTKEELIRFLQFSKIENVHYSALFFVCEYTGLRRGEMLALK